MRFHCSINVTPALFLLLETLEKLGPTCVLYFSHDEIKVIQADDTQGFRIHTYVPALSTPPC